MIRHAIILSALLAFCVAIYGTYTLYEYRKSMDNTENELVPLTVDIQDEKLTLHQEHTDVQKYIEIVSPSGFVNTDGVTIGEYIGSRVILVTFITYGCINCQNTFSFLKHMDEKYKQDGLQIIGIHTPEFAYERDVSNVAEAMRKAGITFPIVLDNEYATWRAYGNNYWPARYLIDTQGNIVFSHFGEGAYEETERMILEALRRAE